MKILHIQAKAKTPIKLKEKELQKIKEKTLALSTTSQHLHQIPKIKQALKKQGKTILTAKGKLTNQESQILGCDITTITKVQNKIQAILYIGSGQFHPLQLALNLRKQLPIYLLSPSGKLTQLDKKEIQKHKKQKQALLTKFLYAKTLILLVSTKPGQLNLKQALKAKSFLEKKYKDKKTFILLSNNFQKQELENFPKAFPINFACPGISLQNILNWKDIEKLT